MPGKPPGDIVLGITHLLELNGEMTRAELCEALGRDRLKVASVVSRMNKALKLRPKRLYVVRYDYFDDTNGRFYPRAVYALGNKPDAKKPKADRAAAARRYRQRERLRVNSVFAYAQPRRVREERRREHGRTSNSEPARIQETEAVGHSVG